jgi:DNA-binding transcriptional regulator YiaG
MAEAMGISRDTLWGWLRGAAKPHHDIDGKLLSLLESERDASSARSVEITALRKQLLARKDS